MEARKVLFVLSNKSNQKSIMSEAETLGALKADMSRAGIDYSDMTFYEGRTRTELKDDAAILPKDIPVPAKGTTPATTTNELVFMLTTANKKIKSGGKIDRTALFAEIKAKGLGDAVIEKFGKNMTQCKSELLIEFLNENSGKAKVAEVGESQEIGNIEITSTSESSPQECVDVKARDFIGRILEALSEGEYEETYQDILHAFNSNKPDGMPEETQDFSNKEEKLSPKEINDMFDWV